MFRAAQSLQLYLNFPPILDFKKRKSLGLSLKGLDSLWYWFNILVHLLTLFEIYAFGVEIILKSTEKLHGMRCSASKGKCISMISDLASVPKFDMLILKRIKCLLTWGLPNHLPSMDHYTGFLHTIENDSLICSHHQSLATRNLSV